MDHPELNCEHWTVVNGNRRYRPWTRVQPTCPTPRPRLTSLGEIRTVGCRRLRNRGNPRAAAEEARRKAPGGGGGRAMAELRHATAAAAATRASSSPSKRDAEAASASSPLVASPRVGGGRDGFRTHQRWSLPSAVRSLLALEDPRSPAASTSYRILVAAIACFALAALFSAPSVWSRLVSSRFLDNFISVTFMEISCLLLTLVSVLDPRMRRTSATRRGFGSTAPG